MVRLLAAFAVTAILTSLPAVAGECFRFGAVVTLTGHYAAGVLPGTDGIVRDLRTDAGRRADVLTLDAPLCVDADVLSTGVPAALSVQVHCPVKDVPDGGALSLTGRLVGARLGNGHTPVLLVCG